MLGARPLAVAPLSTVEAQQGNALSVQGATEQVSIAAQGASVLSPRDIEALQELVSLSGLQATPGTSTDVGAIQESVSITEFQSTLIEQVEIQPTGVAVRISAQPVIVEGATLWLVVSSAGAAWLVPDAAVSEWLEQGEATTVWH